MLSAAELAQVDRKATHLADKIVRKTTKRIQKASLVTDVRAGLFDREIMARRDLTLSQLRIALNALYLDGLIDGVHQCPRCGLRSAELLEDCPRCGVVKAKLIKHEQAPGLWSQAGQWVERVWDAIDCGLYRAVMKLKEKLK